MKIMSGNLAAKLPQKVDFCAESWSTDNFDKVDRHKMTKTSVKWQLIRWKL